MNNGFTNNKQVAKKQVMSRTLKRTQKKRDENNIKQYKMSNTKKKRLARAPEEIEQEGLCRET